MTLDARKVREQEFHDARFGGDEGRGGAGTFYSITGESHGRYKELIFAGCAGKDVLEYGCGPGSYAYDLARRGAHVTGIDISPVAIDRAREQAQREGLQIAFEVRDAEATGLPAASFDLIAGSGIVHHLDIRRAFEEITRLLRPGGRAVFAEPLGHNPLINWYRKRTPEARTPDEHPLLTSDFALARTVFGRVDVSYHHLTAIAAAPFARTKLFRPLLGALSVVDRAILALPPLRRQAWIAVIELGRS